MYPSIYLCIHLSIFLPTYLSIYLLRGNNVTSTDILFANLTNTPSEVATEPQGNNSEMRPVPN